MRLINVKTWKLESFVGKGVPPYAILSHTWGKDEEELSFRDIQTGNIEKAGKIKLEGCCEQAKKDNLGYAWIDTCCIDKTNAVELGEAINSMFRWYRKASICYAYLSDVPSGDNPKDPGSGFFSSRWFRRGWTLQELLAPKKLHFFDQTWTSIGTKEKMWGNIETITGIPREFLIGWAKLCEASVAQRIFNVTMPMIYGEGDKAFSRLQEEIMKKTRDDSILAWGLSPAESIPSKSTDVLAEGGLATAPLNFANCGRIVLRKRDATPVNTIDISGGRLRVHLSLHTTSAGEIYGLLNCGPEHNKEVILGIPLDKAISGVSDEYLRPQGRSPVLLPKATSNVLAKAIHIRIERQSGTHEVMDRRYWLYVDGHEDINLELNENDVYPPVRWENGRAIIAEAKDSETIIRRYLARFRTQDKGSRDFVAVLEFEIQGSQTQARCHLMTGSRDTALQDLLQKLIYIRPEAFWKQSATNGTFNVEVTVKEEYVAQEPMFVVTLARASSSLVANVDATWELQVVDLKLECMRILQEEDRIHLEMEQLDRQLKKKDKLDMRRGPGNWLETMIEALLDTGNIDCDLKRVGDSDSLRLSRAPESGHNICGRIPLLWAAANGRLAVLKLLVEKGAQIEARNENGSTPLISVAARGYEAMARLLIEKGAQIETRNKYGLTPLICAADQGHEAVARLLIEKGAQIEARREDANTPLFWAADQGHEAVARLLIEKGAQIEARGKDGSTPLIFAADQGYEAVARLLIENGAQIEARNKDGWTPLIFAADQGYEALARLLIEKGAQIESRSKNGNTPLIIVAQKGHEAVARLLLKEGAQIEARNKDGWTPLISAADQGYEAVARLLIEKGAQIEARSKNGNTPLIIVARKGHEAVARLLLKKGAQIEARNKDGWTPFNVATQQGHEAVARLLR
ncbi:hypothetical protein DL768_001202 [Monosporascus sp. mg162]|nr:hypothetical protein DL768_001202 [Monosporascus sp. mg162]